MERWQAVVLLLAVVALIYLAMWRGWRRRAAKHDLPPLVPVPPVDEWTASFRAPALLVDEWTASFGAPELLVDR